MVTDCRSRRVFRLKWLKIRHRQFLTTVIAAIGRCLDSAQQETSGYDQLTCSVALIGVGSFEGPLCLEPRDDSFWLLPPARLRSETCRALWPELILEPCLGSRATVRR